MERHGVEGIAAWSQEVSTPVPIRTGYKSGQPRVFVGHVPPLYWTGMLSVQVMFAIAGF